MTAGATGKSSSNYSSVMYSDFSFEMVSIWILYFLPRPGIIFLKCFHGLPFGSFMKKQTFNIPYLLIFPMTPIICCAVLPCPVA